MPTVPRDRDVLITCAVAIVLGAALITVGVLLDAWDHLTRR